MECLERFGDAKIVMRIGSLENRRAYIERVRRESGDVAADRLMAVVQRMWGEK